MRGVNGYKHFEKLACFYGCCQKWYSFGKHHGNILMEMNNKFQEVCLRIGCVKFKTGLIEFVTICNTHKHLKFI